MTISSVLDLLIGLAFLYLLISLMTSAVQEAVAGWLNSRGKNLCNAIDTLITARTNDPNAVHRFYAHPLIEALGKQRRGKKPRLPSYIPSDLFAQAFLDTTRSTGASLRPMSRQEIEDWFNSAMDRAAGWYKRKAQTFILLYTLILTVAFNVDTIGVATALYRNPAVASVSQQAASLLANKGNSNTAQMSWLTDQFNGLNLPVGWENFHPGKPHFKFWFQTVVGWLITTLAASLGSGFWFNTLGELIGLRNAGPKPGSSSSASNTATAAPSTALSGAMPLVTALPMQAPPPPSAQRASIMPPALTMPPRPSMV